jgi:peptidoglycan hydrolase CwlO-like protein
MRHKEKDVEDQSVKLTILEKEHKALVDRTKHLNDQVENRVVLIDKTNAKLDDTHRHIGDLQGAINGLDVEINEVERQNDRHVEN